MLDFETSVSGIEYKVRQLADEVEGLRRTVAKREEECAALQEALQKKENTINKLIEENKIIKLGNKLTERNDSAEIKLKINQMIRAIDRSLTLLKSE